MESLDFHQLRSPVLNAIASGRPFLGICVGMQMLHAGSEEFGGVEGLGIFPGMVRFLPDTVKRPQMQWNIVRTRSKSVLLGGLGDAPWMYFVHSFAPEIHDDVVGVCDYGIEVSSVVERDNVMGTQFHPEKSSASGLAMLRNFVQYTDQVRQPDQIRYTDKVSVVIDRSGVAIAGSNSVGSTDANTVT
jgi:imidazole glycerol-phosphate synthase subunit HisH